ncbi:uncharacterized protein isoform X3 [Leptinotarsa decemlineata]|uniref:uncharacterized protein isoform X3 n=1 Tax=Leptinotarsa decemlineata TaxID=7539 RepID=UPI003D308CDB
MTTENCGRLIKQEKEECTAVQMIISKYESEPEQVKSENIIEVNHDLKCERYSEVKGALHCEILESLFSKPKKKQLLIRKRR